MPDSILLPTAHETAGTPAVPRSYGYRSLFAAALLVSISVPALAARSTVLNVEEWNKSDGSQGITLSADQTPTGKVLFKIRNVSTDLKHEVLLVRTDLSPNDFPKTEDGLGVDEKKLRGLKELGEFEPGQSGAVTLSLKPGRYVVFCNQPGHFHAGMYRFLTVTTATASSAVPSVASAEQAAAR
jgi:uncharacterized cupredoxin-like copper-binding protein